MQQGLLISYQEQKAEGGTTKSSNTIQSTVSDEILRYFGDKQQEISTQEIFISQILTTKSIHIVDSCHPGVEINSLSLLQFDPIASTS